MGRRERRASRGEVPRSPRQGGRASRAVRDRLRHRRVRGRRPGASNRRSRHQRSRDARALRQDAVHRADRRRARGLLRGRARASRAGSRGGSGGGRHAQRDVRRPPPDAHRGADRRHVLRGRDQEVDLHGDERPAAPRGRPSDALLGQRRRRRPRRRLLRALGHRQDDALRRSCALADRRRRARLGRPRHLQHRGRLLREGDPPLADSGARDLQDDAHVRDDSRERRRRRARRARPRRRLEDREHARVVQAGADRRTRCPRSGRGTRARS